MIELLRYFQCSVVSTCANNISTWWHSKY